MRSFCARINKIGYQSLQCKHLVGSHACTINGYLIGNDHFLPQQYEVKSFSGKASCSQCENVHVSKVLLGITQEPFHKQDGRLWRMLLFNPFHNSAWITQESKATVPYSICLRLKHLLVILQFSSLIKSVMQSVMFLIFFPLAICSCTLS